MSECASRTHSKRLVIHVKHIRGKCAVYNGGERIVLEGAELNLEESDKICIHALAPILHYVVALREGADPVALGLSKSGNKAYISCVDPGEPFTPGGNVIFEIEVERG